MSLKFVCPKCKSNEVSQVIEDATVEREVEEITDNGLVAGEHSEIFDDVASVSFQCADCCYQVIDENGKAINDDSDFVKWVKENCPQD